MSEQSALRKMTISNLALLYEGRGKRIAELEKQIVRYDSGIICPSCDLKTIRIAELEAKHTALLDRLNLLTAQVQEMADDEWPDDAKINSGWLLDELALLSKESGDAK